MRSRCGSHALAWGARGGGESVDTPAGEIAGFCQRVGGHLPGNGRFCRPFARAPAAAHRQPRRAQVAGGGFAAHGRGLGDSADRPAQTPQRQNLLLLLVVQDVAHPGQGLHAPDPRQRLGRRQLIVGFEVSINCRFWVFTEVETLVEFPRQSARDVLTEVLRTGARQLLATAIEAEVDEYVAARAKTVDAAGRRGVVRNGHLPKRALQTPLGDVTVQQPRVRDRRPDDERETFRSAILPPYLRKTPSLEALYPWLYLKGLSTGTSVRRCRRCSAPTRRGCLRPRLRG